MKRLFHMLVVAATLGITGLAMARLPALSDEQKAKAEEAKAKAAEGAKKEAELLAKSQDRVAERYKKSKGTPVTTAAAAAKK